MIVPSPLWRALLAVSLWPALAAAQGAPEALPDASDPRVPVPSMAWQSTLPALARGVATGPTDWARVNAAVGAFPRGHADLVQWEARQAAAQTAAPAPSKSIANHNHSTLGKP